MRSPIGRRNRDGDSLITKHTVGNALVLHTEDRISAEAQALALAVHQDSDNDVVVLDLHGDMPVGIWESVAGAINRRGRGIRLVVCGQRQETAVLAGQWLSDRLNRSVLAPYGYLIRGAAGAMFVHDGKGSGWVRYRPGKSPSWDAKRFPKPAWDSAAADPVMTSSAGLAEPLPGGVWIRDVRDAGNLRDHWQWLVNFLPCLPEELPIVLGCPGTPPLPLDDIARFWRGLDADSRARARFVHYGPVQMPRGEALGQVLADLLGESVVCFAGMPVGTPEAPRMHTVTAEGTLGWQVFAKELGYTPRVRAGDPAQTPRVIDHRVPEMLGDPIAPRVYWYANDAVVEVIQSGLWVRPAELPRGADQVRATIASPEYHTLIFDDSTAARAVRMRTLAEDIIARLDTATRDRSALLPASVAVAEGGSGSKAGGTHSDQRVDAVAIRSTTAEMPVYQAAVAPAVEVAAVEVAAPAAEAQQYAIEAFPQFQYAAESTSAEPVQAVAGPAMVQVPVPVAPEATPATPAVSAPPAVPAVAAASAGETVDLSPWAPPEPAKESIAGPTMALPRPAEAIALPAIESPAPPPVAPPTAPPPVGPPSGPLVGPPTAPVVGPPSGPLVAPPPAPLVGPPTAPLVGPPTGALVGPPAAPSIAPPTAPPMVDEPIAPATVFEGDSKTATPWPPVYQPDTDPLGVLAPAPPSAPMAEPPPPATANLLVSDSEPWQTPVTVAAPEPVAEPAPEPVMEKESDRDTRPQPIPQPGASALLRGKSLEDERVWLRRTLSREFDAVASSISRILSEHPGLQGTDARDSADILVDSVAVRLYLSPQGAAIDAGLRTAAKGPHVPFARCVAAGLGRLPSHRGATVVPASPTAREWELLESRRLFTEWGFLGALTEPSSDLPGDTDVLIWSMTARRTRLLEPDGDQRAEDRVLYLPGTSFKVLDVVRPSGGERGRALVRELSADEIDDEGRVQNDRVAFDELATRSLQRYAESWTDHEPASRVGAASRERFGALPGLV